MSQEIKFPNSYNQCKSFCKQVGCTRFGNCAFGFNRIFRGARELRLDFNKCNLGCRLCWSNNNDSCKLFSTEEIFENFVACVHANHKYIYEIKQPEKVDTFKLQSFQIIGGEPLLNPERFQLVYDLLAKIDYMIQQHFDFCSSSLKLDAKNRFKVKLFTNGITIGNGEISIDDIDKLNKLNNIKVDLLVSIKGFHEEGFCALQKEPCDNAGYFEAQISCLEKLLRLVPRNLYIQPVLGFYHSEHFNIKAPNISAEDMFVFRQSSLSQRLYAVLRAHIARGSNLYIEPIHALGKQKKDIEAFFQANPLYLEKTNLIEPDLKSNSKRKYESTKLVVLLGPTSYP